MSDTLLHSFRFVMYSAEWCSDCVRTKQWLEEQGLIAGRDFQDINIEEVPDAAQTVIELNHGMRTIPTLVFPDGTILTEPTVAELQKMLG